ncbi:hypothetical protein [Halomonas sp. RA08-2]|uniref:hypothetical protein n=1 Tax=Halomonas sp. RA08-2 TaxID=3440842 RepID=UPI003EECECC3
MSEDTQHMPRHRRLKALVAIAALSLGSLALAGCGNNDDELPPMEPEDPPMDQPVQEAPMGDEPAMGDEPGMGDEPAMGDEPGMGDEPAMGDEPGMDQDPAMSEEPMDPMDNQEPMMDEMEEDEERGSL